MVIIEQEQNVQNDILYENTKSNHSSQDVYSDNDLSFGFQDDRFEDDSVSRFPAFNRNSIPQRSGETSGKFV